jgi:hypothetical protein
MRTVITIVAVVAFLKIVTATKDYPKLKLKPSEGSEGLGVIIEASYKALKASFPVVPNIRGTSTEVESKDGLYKFLLTISKAGQIELEAFRNGDRFYYKLYKSFDDLYNEAIKKPS